MKPSIRFIDIETSPCVGYFWRPGRKISISADNIVTESRIVCICWKDEGSNKVHSVDWGDGSPMHQRKMLKSFLKELKPEDVLVGHNLDRFDIKWIKTQVLKLGLDPINRLTSIDTLKLTRGNFNFNSNRLDYLGNVLGCGGKLETGGFQLWKDVMNGSTKALAQMIKYCKRDVLLLEEVYNRILPHVVKTGIHKGVLYGRNRASCDTCGSERTQRRGTRVNGIGLLVQKITCVDCLHTHEISMALADKIYGG